MGKTGDLTPEFIVWLYEKHARDAHVRFYTRLMPDVGTWIARNRPDYKYSASVGTVIPADFSILPTEGREIPTLATVSAEKQKLLDEIARLKQNQAEYAEMKKLRKELADLKASLNPPTRRPRKTKQP
jgi:hypothetical protein